MNDGTATQKAARWIADVIELALSSGGRDYLAEDDPEVLESIERTSEGYRKVAASGSEVNAGVITPVNTRISRGPRENLETL